MGDQSKIEWTDATWNPVTGCTKVSSGCKHCYAERVFPRAYGKERVESGMTKGYFNRRITRPRKFTDVQCHPERLDQPLHWKKPRRVFVNSMSDLFHEAIASEFLLAVWAVMEASPWHTYQVLTKRPERMLSLLNDGAPKKYQPEYERRPIPGWSGYYADTEGAIWSDRRGSMRQLSPGIEERGHMHVTLHSGAGVPGKIDKVHRLMLITFDREPLDGEEARHLDGHPSNNAISNLCWGTRSKNGEDRDRHGHAITNQRFTMRQIAEIRIAALLGEAQRSIARRFDTSHTHVARIVTGYAWGFRPLPNVWLGCSVEDQATADERIPLLLQTPAAVRFVSYEPALGPIDFRIAAFNGADSLQSLEGLDWIICGGESGPGARPMHPDWARSVRDQCQAAGVPFFFKQWGEWITSGQMTGLQKQVLIERFKGQPPFQPNNTCRTDGHLYRVGKKAAGAMLDGREWREFPMSDNPKSKIENPK